ncbi:ornithine carbamoyltransferase [Polaromonas sp. OV174]|uniref:ornithine carbamoyltransferase n=1 Tax=Polaromonas sp. OV174 TaxID=1855300 RepID=UPI0015A505EF|nr:ornithine carbamoyltransferase [Polaromonas sp. OV174]
MNTLSLHTSCDGFQALPPEYARAILANALALQRQAAKGAVLPLLKGRNFALLYSSEADAAQALFHRAATELGAQVAHLRFDPSDLSVLAVPQEAQKTAQVLGRLYDALECQGLTPELVRQLTQEAGVPVFNALASPEHPTAAITACLGDIQAAADDRRMVLQAVLLHALGVGL